MDHPARQLAAHLDGLQRGLADVALDAHWAADATMDARYGDAGRRIWRTEVLSRLAHLAESVAADAPSMFAAHAGWAASALRIREVPEHDVRAHFATLASTLAAELPADAAARLVPHLEAARAALAEPCAHGHGLLDDEGKDTALARLYLLHLMERDQQRAAALALDALRGGMPLASVYERVIAPALGEIGRMWHMQEASIADEHYCTAATRSILAQLRAAARAAAPDGRRALCCGVGGDLHDLGLRMAADLLELDGWTVEFLGANVPSGEVVITLEQAAELPGRTIDLACIGARTQLSVRSALDMVASIRASAAGRSTRIILGGGPFSADPALAVRAGADSGVRTLSEAVAEAARLVPAGRSRPKAAAGPTGSP